MPNPQSLPSGSSQPLPEHLDPTWAKQHGLLHERIRESLTALPGYFRTETSIAGIAATDLHTLNTVLGATIEEQVVRVLNSMRTVWDPDENYLRYHFLRQAQTHPDVLFREFGSSGRDGILLGIELKGWYLLAKEEEPSLRFSATRDACAPQDLVVVVPWALSNVISGTPVTYTPWIESARYCADMRTYYWQELRSPKNAIDRSIVCPSGVTPYPAKSEKISDVPGSDPGNNFGRLARTGIMGTYTAKMLETPLCGIEMRYWLRFFKAFRDNRAPERIRDELALLERSIVNYAPEDPFRLAVERTLEAISALLEIALSADRPSTERSSRGGGDQPPLMGG